MRFNIYLPIHEALRLSLSNLLVKIGATNFRDPHASSETLAKLRDQLALSASHLAHEDGFLHPMLEQRVPGSCSGLEGEHAHHRASFHELEGLAAMIEKADDAAQRANLGHSLYLRFSRFVADDLAHMAEEETATLPLLHRHFSDAELMEIEGRIVAAHEPEKLFGSLRLMIPALNKVERVSFLSAVRSSAPPEAFEAILDVAAKPSLPAPDWQHLATGLGLAA